MKFSCTVQINAPRQKVADIFNDRSKLNNWQPNIEQYHTVSGTPRATGAVSKVTFRHRNRVMVMTETIQSNSLPDSFVAIYDHGPVHNVSTFTFKELPGNRTEYTMAIDCDYTNFMAKLMSALMNKMVKQQTQTIVQKFKEYVESLN